jgi:hypothetical protein
MEPMGPKFATSSCKILYLPHLLCVPEWCKLQETKDAELKIFQKKGWEVPNSTMSYFIEIKKFNYISIVDVCIYVCLQIIFLV